MKKQEQIVADYIAWHELNGLFGRVMTVLDAVIDYNSTEHKEGIKSLISNAVFCHDYKDKILFLESDWEEVKKLTFNETEWPSSGVLR